MVVPGSKLAAYFANLLRTGVKSGFIPRLFRLRKAVAAGDISRREFFQRVALIRNEAKAQADLLAVGAQMEANRQAAALGLKVNKGLVGKIEKARSTAEKIAPKLTKRRIREDARKLLNKGPKQVNKEHYEFEKYINEEGFFMEGYPPGSQKYIDNFRAIYKHNRKKNPKSLKQMADDVVNYDVHDQNIQWEIKDSVEKALMKKFGVTKEMLKKIFELKEMKREGFKSFKDPLLDKWFKAREKLMSITKQGTTSMGDYTMRAAKDRSWNATHSGGYDVSEPVRVVKKAAQDIAKHGENKVKSIWDGLSEEFKKGYHGIDEIK